MSTFPDCMIASSRAMSARMLSIGAIDTANASRRVITIAVVGCSPRPVMRSTSAAFAGSACDTAANVRCAMRRARSRRAIRERPPGSRAYGAGGRGAVARACAPRARRRMRCAPMQRSHPAPTPCQDRGRRIDRQSETRARAVCCRSIRVANASTSLVATVSQRSASAVSPAASLAAASRVWKMYRVTCSLVST